MVKANSSVSSEIKIDVSPQWIEIVRLSIVESSSVSATPLSPCETLATNSHVTKIPICNNSSSPGIDQNLQINDASWPVLSRYPIPVESSKVSTDASSLQGTQSPSSERQVIDNAKTRCGMPSRQNSMRQNDLAMTPNCIHLQQSSSTISHNSSLKDNTAQNHSITGSQHQCDSFKNGNGSPNHDRHGSRQHNHRGRREQQHRSNANRNFNGRAIHMPPRGLPRLMPPPLPLPYSSNALPPLLPYHENPYGAYYKFPAVYIPTSDQLHTNILKQIEYYFSSDNLIKDTFLRQHMDDQGWVPIRLIASFRKVMELTGNIQIIINALRTSSILEIQLKNHSVEEKPTTMVNQSLNLSIAERPDDQLDNQDSEQSH
ncbi:la-related protein 1C [Senna tora]|uniref:La-related protein 1C n=1 Tax=Senna tora TaxID=362788 RepID=A0A834U2Y1_9FABA|nr:la-related protein 1C [Senna tora]